MLTPVVFWVFVSVNTFTGAMVAQQFVSEKGCNDAIEFVLLAKGTTILSKCIKDEAPKR